MQAKRPNTWSAVESFGFPKQLLAISEIQVEIGKDLILPLDIAAQQWAWFDRHNGLLEHIEQHGLQNPIAVIPKNGQFFFSGIGAARVQCAVKKGIQYIDAIILENATQIPALLREQAKTGPQNYCVEPDNRWWE